MQIKIQNPHRENLDVLIEEAANPRATVVMAHGIGTDKHETDGLFDDIAQTLIQHNFRVVRFDFAGFGQSEGKSEDFDLKKGGQDVQAVIDWAGKNFPQDIYLLAQSLATAITAYHQPQGVKKIIFTAHVNPNPSDLVDGLQNRMKSRAGAIVNEQGITIYPRSSGVTQKFGPTLWQTLRSLRYMDGLKLLAKQSHLLVIRPKQDEIVILDDRKLEPFRHQSDFQYLEIDGDHSFRGLEIRQNLCQAIVKHFTN